LNNTHPGEKISQPDEQKYLRYFLYHSNYKMGELHIPKKKTIGEHEKSQMITMTPHCVV